MMALDRNLVIRTLSGIVMLVVVLGAVLVSLHDGSVVCVTDDRGTVGVL